MLLFVIIGGLGVRAKRDIGNLSSNLPLSKIKSDVDLEISQEVTLIIDYGPSSQEFNLKVGEPSTVLDLLNKGDITFNYDQSEAGVFIKSIEGVQNSQSQGKFWMYYVNGELAPTGVSQQLVNSGDIIEFKFESPSF